MKSNLNLKGYRQIDNKKCVFNKENDCKGKKAHISYKDETDAKFLELKRFYRF